MRILCIIPTYNGCAQLLLLLRSLCVQNVQLVTKIVDSSSMDGTQQLAKKYSVDLDVIQDWEFNHGATRQLMVNRNPDFDVYVFLTQDAYLVGTDAISKIIEHFDDPVVGAVCGRQLPHLDAKPRSQHARLFNYPDEVEVKSIADVGRLGVKAAFMSNSFAAYRGQALKEIGGFPNHVIFGEDMYVASKMLMSGWKVAYAGDALARHSHNYSKLEEFQRYFDMGVFHAREPWIRQTFGGAGGEGVRYVKSELRFLGWRRLHLWPGSLFRNALKLIAYKLGQQEAHLPIALKKRIGMHKRYWDGPFAHVSDQRTPK